VNWVELLVGALLGVVSAAMFEEGLRQKLRRTFYRWYVRLGPRQKPPTVFRGEKFMLGPLSLPVQLIEGDGTRAISRQNIRVEVEPTVVRLPKEMVAWRAEVEQQRERSGNRFWNGLRYAVVRVESSRTPRREDPQIYLMLRHTDYFTFCTVQQLDRQFDDGTTPRQRYLDGKELDALPDFMFPSFGINVAVVTADRQLIITHRSRRVGSGADEWNVSANEGLSRDLDANGRHPPDLYRVAERGLVEELALEYGEYDLSLLAIGLERVRYQWAAIFIARLRSLTAAELQDRHARGIQDRWEHRVIEYVSFRPDTVLSYLLQPDRLERWAPCAPVAFWLALTNTYGRRWVERAGRQLLGKTQE
jgi:hypothetical protein